MNFTFRKEAADDAEICQLRAKWRGSLTSPEDDMWLFLRDNSTHYKIKQGNKAIGYACVDGKGRLLQFYALPSNLSHSGTLFGQFLKQTGINTGIVGTNNPIFLSLALDFTKGLSVHSFLFRDVFDKIIPKKDGALSVCQVENSNRAIRFYQHSTGGETEWLAAYLGGLISKKELFILEKEERIIGACEVRRNSAAPKFADIGMVVAPEYRREGYGTYLLDRAKRIALERGMTPICSCEKGNVGSFKSITNCGFYSIDRLLEVTFE